MNLKKISLVIFTIFGLLLALLLLNNVDSNEIVLTLKSANIFYLLLGFVIYLLVNILRAVRFFWLLKSKVGFFTVLSITGIHNLINSVLPARLGEFSYPILLKKFSDYSFHDSLSNIVIARIFDIFGITLLFIVSIFFYLNNIYIKTLVLITIPILFIFLILFMKFAKIIRNIFILFSKGKNRFLNKISNSIVRIIDSSLNYSLTEKIKLLIISLIINFLMFIFGYTIVIGLGSNLSIWAVFVGGTLAVLTTILPIQGLFNIGTLELGWSLTYVLVGMTTEQAILTGFSYHIINILFTFIIFVISLLILFTRINSKFFK